MMAEYRLTTKGKIVVLIYLSLLLLLIVFSGKYIINFAQNAKSWENNIEMPSDSNVPSVSNEVEKPLEEDFLADKDETTDETTDETADETIENEENEEDELEAGAHVYTKNEIEILRQSSIVLYFDSQSFRIYEDDYDQLDKFMEVAQQFPEEIIAVVGHSNGYPNFENTVLEESLSRDRANAVRQFLIEKGLKNNRIMVSYYGSNIPVTKNFDDQSLNDRVIVYFRDHIVTSVEDK